mmetsp:Transcript_406/g.1124  ORF Transcript_406/g.1124 Transcript_406/m.1124 type:complete len:95 (+) Transcript_406:23-307(+)
MGVGVSNNLPSDDRKRPFDRYLYIALKPPEGSQTGISSPSCRTNRRGYLTPTDRNVRIPQKTRNSGQLRPHRQHDEFNQRYCFHFSASAPLSNA